MKGVNKMKEKTEFIYEDIDFYLKDSFKGLSKKYMLECIFNEDIQKNWYPEIGDIIVTKTGNIYVISSSQNLHKDLGGKHYFFGGYFCNKDGGHIQKDTHCSVMNKDGLKYEYDTEKKEYIGKKNLSYSSFKDFRYIPYPHELTKK
jgi:CTP:phosphocholine cytidylyltransferase-like protein